MGRTATGVRGIKLHEGDQVCSLDVVDESKTLLITTENGYGKRTEFSAYESRHRGGQGIIAIKGADRNGLVVSAHSVADDESIISITSDGLMVRQRVSDITVVGRTGMGVRLVRLNEGEKLVSVSVIEAEEEQSTEAEVQSVQEEANNDVSTETPSENPSESPNEDSN
jgi:DNA gyrase subunit A